jgi:hypothetical protein
MPPPAIRASFLQTRAMRSRFALRVALVAALLVGALGVAVVSAAASTINTSTKVRACTNLDDGSCKITYKTLYKGTAVTMRCWRDESAYAGTVRWFWVAGGGVEGFVSANYVSSQSRVGNCKYVPRIQAARWAGTKLGQLKFVDECLPFVRAAWSYAGKTVSGGTGSALNTGRTTPTDT